MTQKPNLESTLQRVLAEFRKQFIDMLGNYPDLSNKFVFEATEEFISQAFTEFLKEAFAALDLETPENFKEVSNIYIKGWNAALQAIEELKKHYLEQ